MKKKLKIFLLLLILSVQTVYAKPEYLKETRLTVSNSTGIGLEVLYSANNELLDEYNLTKNDLFDIDSLQISLSERGYIVQDSFIQDGVALGVEKNFGDIKAVSSLKKVKVNLTDIAKEEFKDDFFFTKKLGLLKTTYSANFIFDYSNVTNEDVELDQVATIKFYLYTPKACKSHNASEVIEDNIIAWDLKLGQMNEVNFEIQETNTIVVLILIVIAIILLILLVSVLVRKIGHKRIEYQETKGKEKKKKEKKKKEKKVNQKNIHNNGMTFDNEEEKKPVINPANEFVVTNTNPASNQMPIQGNINNQQNNQVNNQPNMYNQNQMNSQPNMYNQNQMNVNQNVYNQGQANMYNQGQVNNQQNNQANQIPMQSQPMNQNMFNQQPVNRPTQNNNLYNSEPKDYTDVFNQMFNFDNHDNNNKM